MTGNILVVDDEKRIRLILCQLLSDEGYQVTAAASGEEALALADNCEPELVLMDQRMPGIDGIETMVRLRAMRPGLTVIILTAHAALELAVTAIKQGAYDYLAKPFDNEELLIVIRRALEHSRLTGRVDSLERQLGEKYSFSSIIGVSGGMRRVFEQVGRVCETGATVLIEGESGTGKELVARAIHFNSPRRGQPFVTVNCGAIPLTLIESELFGHEKGAFTGAAARCPGKFEQAQGGTFLLDEVGELPLEAQVKLLRVLDERRVTRLGGTREPAGGCAPDRRHQQGAGARGRAGPFPAGPVLPAEHCHDPHPAFARAARGHSALGRALPGQAWPRPGPGGGGDHPPGAGLPDRL